MLTLRRTTAAGLFSVVFAITLAFAPSARADLAPAYLEKTQYLVELPGTTHGNSFIQRDIYLDRGCYLRSTFVTQQSPPPAGDSYYGQIYLSAGWYHWEAELIPGDYWYHLWTDIWGTSPSTDPAQWEPGDFAPSTGTWTWGMRLEWTGNTCSS